MVWLWPGEEGMLMPESMVGRMTIARFDIPLPGSSMPLAIPVPSVFPLEREAFVVLENGMLGEYIGTGVWRYVREDRDISAFVQFYESKLFNGIATALEPMYASGVEDAIPIGSRVVVQRAIFGRVARIIEGWVDTGVPVPGE